jgi:hypothetical protein
MQKDLNMQAGSLTLHTQYMRCHLHRIHGACSVIDTACMIDVALAAFKGNIYQKRELVLSYHTTTKIYKFLGST